MYTVGAGGGMMSDGLAGMAQSVADLRDAVGNGARLDPEAAQALVLALEEAMKDVDKAMQAAHRDARSSLPIGDTPGAKLYRPVFAAVEDDPD